MESFAYISNVAKQLIQPTLVASQYDPLLQTQQQYQAQEGLSFAQMEDLQKRLVVVKRLLEPLSPASRRAFWMYRIEGQSLTTIAQALQMRESWVEACLTQVILELSAAHAWMGAG